MGIGRFWRLTLFLALVALASERPAQAQWGFGGGGFGWGGWGGWGGYMLPSYAYGVSTRASVRDGTTVDTSNSYQRRSRVSTYQDKYDPITMRHLEDRVARRPRPQAQRSGTTTAQRNANNTAAPAPAPAANNSANTALASQRQVMSLSAFFDANGKLAWPGDSPVSGELIAKRQAADAAIEAVHQHAKDPGGAPVSLVADARKKLLAYGRPALQAARTSGPHALADNFHSYLLDLYDALAAAAQTPRVASSR